MRRLAVGFFAGVGLLTVLLIVAVAIVVIPAEAACAPALPGNIILSIDLTQGLAEPRRRPGGSIDRRRQAYLARFSRCDRGGRGTTPGSRASSPASAATIRARRGAADPRRDQRLSRQRQVCTCLLRQLWRVRRRHPPLLPGERVRPDLAAADGHVGLTGLYAETPYFKGTLDMLGIVAEFDHIEGYKTAINVLTNTR